MFNFLWAGQLLFQLLSFTVSKQFYSAYDKVLHTYWNNSVENCTLKSESVTLRKNKCHSAEKAHLMTYNIILFAQK